MSEIEQAIGCTLFESDGFGGWKFPKDGVSTTLRANKVCAGIVEIRKVDNMYAKNTIARAEQSRAEQLDCCVRLGNAYNDEKFTGGNYGGNVWDVNGLAPTMKTGASASQQFTVEVKKMDRTKFLGSYNGNGPGRSGAVFDKNELSPTLNTCGGGGTQPHILEVEKMENDFKSEKLIIQKCGDRDKDGNYSVHDYSNCLPANPMSDRGQLLLEQQIVAMRGRDKDNPSDRTVGNPNLEQRLELNSNGTSNTITSVQKDNLVLSIENAVDPDFHNFLYEIDGEVYLIRIRKLIPKECLRLMDVPEEYIERMLQVESNTNLYRAAGNSIVCNCLVAIFGQMFEGKENVYKGV